MSNKFKKVKNMKTWNSSDSLLARETKRVKEMAKSGPFLSHFVFFKVHHPSGGGAPRPIFCYFACNATWQSDAAFARNRFVFPSYLSYTPDFIDVL